MEMPTHEEVKRAAERAAEILHAYSSNHPSWAGMSAASQSMMRGAVATQAAIEVALAEARAGNFSGSGQKPGLGRTPLRGSRQKSKGLPRASGK